MVVTSYSKSRLLTKERGNYTFSYYFGTWSTTPDFWVPLVSLFKSLYFYEDVLSSVLKTFWFHSPVSFFIHSPIHSFIHSFNEWSTVQSASAFYEKKCSFIRFRYTAVNLKTTEVSLEVVRSYGNTTDITVTYMTEMVPAKFTSLGIATSQAVVGKDYKQLTVTTLRLEKGKVWP